MSIDKEFVDTLPKCELHLHIEGTLEPELRFQLAERNRMDLDHASPEEVRASYTFNDLGTFLTSYYAGMTVLQTEPDFYDLTWSYFERVAEQNVAYVELFFDPQAHTSRGVPFDIVVRGIRRAQMDAENRLGVRSGLIMCFLREFQSEYAMATLMESLPYRGWIIGVGLDSYEPGNPPNKFASVFARARQEGYRLTVHCDVDQENSLEHIRQCLHDIRAERVDHGLNVLDSKELVREVVERSIGLTCCPISNEWVTGETKTADIRELMNRNVKVTVNSDDPAYFGGYVQENLEVLTSEGYLSREDLIQLQRNAIDVSWAPPNVKREFQERLNTLN